MDSVPPAQRLGTALQEPVLLSGPWLLTVPEHVVPPKAKARGPGICCELHAALTSQTVAKDEIATFLVWVSFYLASFLLLAFTTSNT